LALEPAPAFGLPTTRSGWCRRYIESKKKAPGDVPGLRDDCLGGTLDAPILSQRTNQARRGSRKRLTRRRGHPFREF